jgi:hypothetical protein
MKVDRLFNKMWNIYADSDNMALLSWIKSELSKKIANLDYHYVHLEVLSLINYDNEREHREPEVIQLCSAVIRANNADDDKLSTAKAYAYRGELKFLAIDRRRDFDKARHLLWALDQTNSEVKFLHKFIDMNYPLPRREYLILDPQVFRNQS